MLISFIKFELKNDSPLVDAHNHIHMLCIYILAVEALLIQKHPSSDMHTEL